MAVVSSTSTTEILLHSQQAADGGVRYLLNVIVDRQTLPLLAASTYDGIALRDTARLDCTVFQRQLCFNSSGSSHFSLCPWGIDQPLVKRAVSSSINMRTVVGVITR